MRMSIPSFSLFLLLTACGGKHPGAYQGVNAAGATAGAEGVTSEADQLWAERLDGEKLAQALEKYEAVLESDPQNRTALERLTRGYYFYGDAFSQDKDTKIERWGKAIEWGSRCLALNEDMAAKIAAGEKEKVAVEAATKADVPCLYWMSSALGKWGKSQSLSKTLKHLPTVKAYISKVEQLEPAYNHYGPARYWGAYYAALPSFAGQDFDKSAEYFAASIEGSKVYLGTPVLRAEYLSAPLGDLATFNKDLAFVLNADASKISPELVAENTMEQEKAKRLLAKKGELFDKKTLAAEQPVPEVATEAPAAKEAATEAPAADEAPAEEAASEAPAEDSSEATQPEKQ